MILADSSVWIDLLRNRDTPPTVALRALLSDRLVVGVGDLILAEVLQGTRDERDFEVTLATLRGFEQVAIVDRAVAVQAARHYRALRALGTTPRKTIDTLIATRCILDRMPLLYGDRDFDPFVRHFGLRSALGEAGET